MERRILYFKKAAYAFTNSYLYDFKISEGRKAPSLMMRWQSCTPRKNANVRSQAELANKCTE